MAAGLDGLLNGAKPFRMFLGKRPSVGGLGQKPPNHQFLDEVIVPGAVYLFDFFPRVVLQSFGRRCRE